MVGKHRILMTRFRGFINVDMDIEIFLKRKDMKKYVNLYFLSAKSTKCQSEDKFAKNFCSLL